MSKYGASKVEILIGDKKYYLLASINALDKLEDEFGSVADLFNKLEQKGSYKALKKALHILMHGEKLSEEEIGELLSYKDLEYTVQKILETFNIAFDDTEESTEETNEKNA